MNEKINSPRSRRSFLKRSAVATVGISGLSIGMIGSSAAASTNKYYVVYKSQKGSGINKMSKLQARVEWDVKDGILTYAGYSLSGNAGGVGEDFYGITYETESGGVGEGYYTVYAEGDYYGFQGNAGDYKHTIEVQVQDDGSSHANTSHRTVKVDEGTR
ncbi:twin-arginine translocation signal domain-containing protein [Haloferax mucosum]|uniref:twin-arginine translocation signal domain-containing protein n=1 Tax=Haloferax mucosum TaxID=403181 RepID=UPI001267781C|nr:twin-arginine translocation signal domain-containing protein [Haloferax mucosum]